MDTKEYLALVEGGIDHFTVEFHSDTKPAAAHKARRLRKVVTAVCMTGASYADLRVNKDRETGPLPWGVWMDGAAPFVIQHKGQDYARLYVIDHGVTSIYTVDGEVVDRDTYNGYLTPSQANASRPNGGTITVKMSGIRLVGRARLPLIGTTKPPAPQGPGVSPCPDRPRAPRRSVPGPA